jgi:hypothetical protein
MPRAPGLPPLALLLLLVALAPARPALGAPQLRTLALVNTENDEDQTATVAEVDAASGKVALPYPTFAWSVQWSTSLDCATTFAASAAPGPRWLSLVGQGPSVATVDAGSGKLLHLSPAISVAYVVESVAWDEERGDLVALGFTGTTADLIRINATTGVVTVEVHGVAGARFPQACASAISLASRTLYTVADETESDDADQSVEAFDLDTGKLRHSVAWPAKSKKEGPLGAPVVVAAAAAGGPDTLALIWADADLARPLRFVTLDFASGNLTVLAELPRKFADTVVDIGGVGPAAVRAAADGSFSLVAVAFDNSEDAAYLLQLAVGAGAGAGSGNATLTLLDGEGGAMLWSPVFVDV